LIAGLKFLIGVMAFTAKLPLIKNSLPEKKVAKKFSNVCFEKI